MPKIRLQNLFKCYGSTAILPDIDLQMANSECTVLVKPSGYRKSTTLQMIAGLKTVSTGRTGAYRGG